MLISPDALCRRLKTSPLVLHLRKAKSLLKELELCAGRQDVDMESLFVAIPDLQSFLSGVMLGSPFLTRLMLADTARLVRLLTQDPDQSFQALLAQMQTQARQLTDEGQMTRCLRLAKQEAALLIALCDCAGIWSLEQVTNALTTLAEVACSTALAYLLREQAARGRIEIDPEQPERDCGFFILGMGKLGGRELNYSSDIDLIAFYDRDKIRLRDLDEHQAFFVKLTQGLTRLIHQHTFDGQVFRVDWRLRPDPGSTPLAASTAYALGYYETVGQNWERAAMIKARPIAGDLAAGELFLRDLHPFIWRKFLDFAAIADIHAMKRQIHAVKGHGTIAIEGHHLKLGRGGIREIEFFVQTQQLIAGGRDPNLRVRSTLHALDALVNANWIKPQVRDDLSACYITLRGFEHRIQMMDDAQTHTLPTDAAEFITFTQFAGFKTPAAFAKALRPVLLLVQSHYADLFEEPMTDAAHQPVLFFTGLEHDPKTLEMLATMGFSAPTQASDIVRQWLSGRYAATRMRQARERLNEIIPRLLEALAVADQPHAALLAFDRFLASLPAGVQLFSLLRANPNLIDLLAEIINIAPRLTQILARRPRVLDGLIEQFHAPTRDVGSEMDNRLTRVLSDARDFQDILDLTRIFAQEQMFLIGVRILIGALPAHQAGPAYTQLATTLTGALHRAVDAEMLARYGRTPRGVCAILALGKFGSGEMTASSDLDLMLLYDDEALEQSDGAKPLYASDYYTRTTQRLIGALSAPTGQGSIYEVDFRLRPSGNKGPLATSLTAFRDYQANEAWTWEHMALTRGRVVSCTCPAFQQEIDQSIRHILLRPRDMTRLKNDIADMRKTLLQEKPASSVWDMKHLAGGIIDVEFIAQFLVLGSGHAHPDLWQATTAHTFTLAAQAGLLDDDSADKLVAALHFYTSLTQVIRLCLDGRYDPQMAPKGLEKRLAVSVQLPDIHMVEMTLHDHAHHVRRVFDRLIKPIVWPKQSDPRKNKVYRAPLVRRLVTKITQPPQ